MSLRNLKFIVIAYLSILFCLLSTSISWSQNTTYSYDFNNRCKKAYALMMSLRIKEANLLLEAELQEHPQNLIPIFLANYDDCLTLLFNGDPAEYSKRKGNLSKRVALLEQGNSQSPWYKYTLATLYFQWASVRIRFGENFAAGTDFRKSFILLKDNHKKFPNFTYNQILLGVEEAVVGTIPDNYKWISSLLGMKGDVRKGIGKLVNFLNENKNNNIVLKEEALFYYCYLKFSLLSDHNGVWRFMNESNFDFANQHLYTFMKANFALNDNKANAAETVLAQRNVSKNYLEVPVFNYLMGVALLQKLDDDCVVYFKRFLERYKGKMFIKDAYQKLSYYYLATGNNEEATTYKNSIKKAGTATIDADKQAQRYAEGNTLPNAQLMRARLLCDGGYFDRALSILKSHKSTDYSNIADQLEFNYRYARIYTLMGQPDLAIPYYTNTIKNGRARPEHFAARSALELGQIYEMQGLKDKAIASYKDCLSMKNHDYKSSIDQKAKSGINRLGLATD
jgi:predicted negative regulator of RcsB-dependent stress response